jgi:hypothetical protein
MKSACRVLVLLGFDGRDRPYKKEVAFTLQLDKVRACPGLFFKDSRQEVPPTFPMPWYNPGEAP